jgi:hypothetical protein
MKDAHVHISKYAHALSKKGATKAKITLKDFVSKAIISATKPGAKKLLRG